MIPPMANAPSITRGRRRAVLAGALTFLVATLPFAVSARATAATLRDAGKSSHVRRQ